MVVLMQATVQGKVKVIRPVSAIDKEESYVGVVICLQLLFFVGRKENKNLDCFFIDGITGWL